MQQQLPVMSVTALADGVCVACVDNARRWVRPTREGHHGWRQLQVADLKDASGRVVVQVGHEVRWDLGPRAPQAVHTEDVLVGQWPPQLVRALGYVELLAWCEYLREQDLTAFLSGHDRSLMLYRPGKIHALSFSATGKGGIAARLQFQHKGLSENYSVTDLRWRALGRALLTRLNKSTVTWSEIELRRHAVVQIRYLAVGRGQPWEGKRHPLAGAHWPFVINVFSDPPLMQEIDYANL
jgi:hypothetical protein